MKDYQPIEAKAHTPPYKIHRYFARRPWNVFSQLIETYSKPADIILDPFCGGGVTIYEGLKSGRKVIGFDLNPLSIFIVKNMIKKDIVIIGEVGLASEIRSVIQLSLRLNEAQKLGFKQCIIPKNNLDKKDSYALELTGARNIQEAMEYVF